MGADWRLLVDGAQFDRPNLAALASACQAGDLGSVQQILRTNPRLVPESDNRSAVLALSGLLRIAVANKHTAIAKALLDKGARPHAWEYTRNDSYLDSPFMLAIREGDVSLIRLCLAHGAGANQADGRGSLPLHAAVWAGHAPACKLLLENGARVNAREKQGDASLGGTELHELGWTGDPAAVASLLIERGADIQARDNLQRTPLHCAAQHSAPAACVLIKKGADVRAVDRDGCTPLHFAADGCKADVVKMLVECGADVNATDQNGKTPLEYAIASRNLHKGFTTPEDAELVKQAKVIEAFLKEKGAKRSSWFGRIWHH